MCGLSGSRTARVETRKKPLQILMAIVVVLQLTACSKTVQWEEEVPLNTGETIWVKRTVNYSIQGGAGNPLDMAYRPQRAGRRIEFTWQRKSYSFDRNAGVMLLAISPQGQPVLVGEADAGNWYAANNYRCIVPFYVQFVPDATGINWRWPSQIEPWLYNLESNFLFEIPTPDKGNRRYTVEQRKAENYPGLMQRPSRQKVDPTYSGDQCKPQEK